MTPQSDPRGGPDGAGATRGAVVTAAGGPIGWAIARALAALGYAVHLTDPDGRVATRAAAEIGPPSFGSALDVRSLPACRAAASRTRRRLDSLELWVNAATLGGSGSAWELDERSRQRILELILGGTINGTLAALEVMRPSGKGQVINVIELGSLLPRAGRAVYSAAQHGALAFSQGAMADLRSAGQPEVAISCLCPTGKVAGEPQRLSAALAELIDRPRPLLAIPRWRGALTRANYMWPGSGPVSSGLASALLDPARRRPRRGG
jgi:NAD(P)-dependent dehydrogenase (short-subunit alcohol dehydrogenase family)